MLILCRLQSANDAAAAGKPWPADTVAALVDGGLGSFRLAHAESAAQSAQVFTATRSAQEDPYKPKDTRRLAADVLWGGAQSMTPAVARAIFKRGLVEPLLEVGSPRLAPVSEVLRLQCESQGSLAVMSRCQMLF